MKQRSQWPLLLRYEKAAALHTKKARLRVL